MNRMMNKTTTEIVTKKTKTTNLRIMRAKPGRNWYTGSWMWCFFLSAVCWMAVIQQAGAVTQPWPRDTHEVTFPLPGGNFHYYTLNLTPDRTVTSALIVLHGYPRDAANTLTAAVDAVKANSDSGAGIVVAPLFQVSPPQAAHCTSEGLPDVQAGDAVWTCHSWLEGGLDQQKKTGAFAAIDGVIRDLKQRWPTVNQITVAGFSAGGQFVQHYIGFAHLPDDVAVRYVVADPGSWLYFDPQSSSTCSSVSDWKYGLAGLPAWLKGSATTARERYRSADVHYLEGEEDQGKGPKRYWRILDKSCAANAQGQSRLERGRNYERYDREVLKPSRPHTLTVVPECAHDVRCVFPSAEGRQVLFNKG